MLDAAGIGHDASGRFWAGSSYAQTAAATAPPVPASAIPQHPNVPAPTFAATPSAAEPQKIPSSVQPIYLSSKASTYAVASAIRVFEDPGHQLTFKEILPQYRTGDGKAPPGGESVFLGYSSSSYWLVFSVYNLSQSKSRWILDFGNRATGTIGVVNRLAIYTDVDPDRPLMSDGRLVKNKLHILGQERNALPLNLEPGQLKTIGLYIEPAPGVALSLAPQLEEPAVYTTQQDQTSMWNNFVKVGALLAACIYFVFWINYRNAVPVLLICPCGAGVPVIYTAADEIVPYGNNTTAQYIDNPLRAAGFHRPHDLAASPVFAPAQGQEPHHPEPRQRSSSPSSSYLAAATDVAARVSRRPCSRASAALSFPGS